MSLRIPFLIAGIVLVPVIFINYNNYITTNNGQWIYLSYVCSLISFALMISSFFIDKPLKSISTLGGKGNLI